MEGAQNIEKDLEQLAHVSHNKYLMSDKKIAFFGDTNKVMLFDLNKQDWAIHTVNANADQPLNLDFMYYAAAVTLPNGDALITGGGSSTFVYQFVTQKCELVPRASMN